MSRPVTHDYDKCINCAVPVPEDLHKEFKLYCVRNGVPMKEIMNDILVKGIEAVLKEGEQ